LFNPNENVEEAALGCEPKALVPNVIPLFSAAAGAAFEGDCVVFAESPNLKLVKTLPELADVEFDVELELELTGIEGFPKENDADGATAAGFGSGSFGFASFVFVSWRFFSSKSLKYFS
jgi:hypothetical protein